MEANFHTGNNLDSSGRRVLKQSIGVSPIFEKDENAPYGYRHGDECECPECREEDVDNGPQEDKILAGILASIKLVNIHLLCIDARQRRLPRLSGVDPNILKKRDNYMLQSEAQALFKGNFIRLLKKAFSSSDINRIKKSCSFVVNIGTREGYPEVTWVLFYWDNERYMPKIAGIIRECLIKSFAKLDTRVTHEAWKEAFAEWKSKGGESVLGPVTPPANISQLNFDSLRNIKF